MTKESLQEFQDSKKISLIFDTIKVKTFLAIVQLLEQQFILSIIILLFSYIGEPSLG